MLLLVGDDGYEEIKLAAFEAQRFETILDVRDLG